MRLSINRDTHTRNERVSETLDAAHKRPSTVSTSALLTNEINIG